MIARLDSYYQSLEDEAQQEEEPMEEEGDDAQEEAERLQKEQEEAERLKIEQEEAERLKIEQQEAERLKIEQEEAERVQREKEEAERLEAERLQKEQEEAERLKKEQEEEAEKLRLEQEEKLRLEEEAKQKAIEAENKRKEEEAAEQKALEEERRKQEEEAKQKALEEEKLRLEAEKQAQEEKAKAEEQEAKKPLFKHQIAPPPQISNLAGPPPTSDDLEDSPKKGPVPLMSLDVDNPGEKSGNQDLRLPKALEEALAYKSERANQVGVSPTDIARVEREGFPQVQSQLEEVKKPKSNQVVQLVEGMDEDDDKGKGKKKNKKKKKKRNRPEEWARQAALAEQKRKEEEEAKKEEDVEVEYIQEKLDLDPMMFKQFARIFEAFKIKDSDDDKRDDSKKADLGIHNEELKKVPKFLEAEDMIEEKDEDETEGQAKLSKRKMKKLNRLSVAELKQLVTRPDVVEMHDVTAKDPGLLVHLKSIRNTVPVPRHWCFKRKYLQGKRGIEKPPFDLPEFIKKTGIMEMRAALQEKEEAKGMKTKMREKVRPKLGKIDIDYQKLHDAFFKWQTKPRMTPHGDLYYEGKEFEIRLKEKKPGDLSDDLRTALGMPVGPNAHKVPPPWLISMQRYGPPPSYPNLKIPGLNAPIPDGCSFGYHAGGWGKPPVDETGKPLYGDVFGTSDSGYSQQMPVEEVDQTLWGEMESESEEEESEEEEEEDEEGMEEISAHESGMQTPIIDNGMATPSGMSSVGGPPGQETPELIELRKRKIEADMEGGETPNLYTILPERKNERVGAGMMGSTHTYDLPSAGGTKRVDTGAVEMALNPDEVDLIDSDAMQAKAEAALREKQASLAKEDLSDMVAEHAAKQSNKRKRQAGKEDTKSSKKYKEFKF